MIIIIVSLLLAEPNNEIYSTDISSTGATLATAGCDATLRIYDTRTTKVINFALLN